MTRIAIIGGGISGLAAAFALEEHRRDRSARVEFVLYEVFLPPRRSASAPNTSMAARWKRDLIPSSPKNLGPSIFAASLVLASN